MAKLGRPGGARGMPRLAFPETLEKLKLPCRRPGCTEGVLAPAETPAGPEDTKPA